VSKWIPLSIWSSFIFLPLVIPSVAAAQQAEEAILQAAASVLNEAMSKPDSRVPEAMLADAHGVAIIPNVIKGSFVIGARRGRGVLFVREPNGVWHAPVFITLTGGNIGWQAGVQSSDVVLVFKTSRCVQSILSGRLTIGGDVAAAAGPVGRQGAVATDTALAAEIFTYARSRGLFAGVSLDGSVVHIDQFATSNYYRSPAPGQPVVVPPAAQQLTQLVASYAGVSPDPLTPVAQVALSTPHHTSDSDVLRSQLVQVTPELYKLLDEHWQQYLAIPPSIFTADGHPSVAEVRATLQRFDDVARDARYQSLAARPEFQSVDGLLRHYYQTLSRESVELKLPPPPIAATP
jgi:lipid-binding SYLF domain-containing protein